ncbi:MAG: GH116 family glycosyl hydrolase, partial [Planctomycetota bacterium]
DSCTLPLWLIWRCPTASYRLGTSDDAGFGGTRSRLQTWPAPYARNSTDLWDLARQVHAADAGRYAATADFRCALEHLDADPAVIDALGSTLTALRSPTTIALPDGDLWSYEGSGPDEGSCPGSCGHVWAYDQALAWLWPDLARAWVDRVLRHLVTDEGASGFRIPMPPGPPPSTARPAVEAQCNLIIRCCQLWRRWGDADWVQERLPILRRVLAWTEEHWCDARGVVDAVVHNTFDVVFTGREPRASILVQAARAALACLEADLGDADAARALRLRQQQAAQALAAELFDGWYRQAPEATAEAPRSGLADDPLPMHQVGDGCLADQLLGAWLAHCAGVPFDLPYEDEALRAVFQHNWRPSLAGHVCVQRVFALDDEAGLILVTWPHGGRPQIPMPYSDEAGWTGVEYALAGHLLLRGDAATAETIVRGVRARFDGRRRNPCNEYECGSYYGRSLASWSLLLGLNGQHYDPLHAQLCLHAPRTIGRGLLWAAAGCWGSITRLGPDRVALQVHGGSCQARSLLLDGQTHRIEADVLSAAGMCFPA